jgi:predicted nucleic acid-binding protein
VRRRVADSIRERGVFIDTSAFLALVATNDSRHLQAKRILDRLRERRYYLYTTKYVIYESHAGILSDVGQNEARLFLAGMARTATRVVRVTGVDEDRARQLIDRQTDKEYSLCDATSFAVMKRLGLVLAFAFDDHFRQAGLSTPLDYEDWP